MFKKLIALIAAVLIILVAISLTPKPANASRPIVGYNYPDQCRNIKGVQPIYMMIGTGPYRFKSRAHKICYIRKVCPEVQFITKKSPQVCRARR